MRYLILGMLAISLSGCNSSGGYIYKDFYRQSAVFRNDEVPEEKPPETNWLPQRRTVSVDDIVRYTVPLKHDKHLYLEDSQVCNGGELIKLSFRSQQSLELCEARQLIVDVVEGFLTQLNGKQTYTDFNPSNLKVTIDFQSFHGAYIDRSYIGWLVMEKELTYYYAFDIKCSQLSVKHTFTDGFRMRVEPYSLSLSYATSENDAELEYVLRHPKPAPFFLNDGIVR